MKSFINLLVIITALFCVMMSFSETFRELVEIKLKFLKKLLIKFIGDNNVSVRVVSKPDIDLDIID